MKNALLQLSKIMIPVLFMLVTTNTQARNSTNSYSYEEVGGQPMVIEFVSKKVIKLAGKEYAIAAVTKLLTHSGEQLDDSALKVGVVVEIVFDDQQKFLNRPTLSHIYIH